MSSGNYNGSTAQEDENIEWIEMLLASLIASKNTERASSDVKSAMNSLNFSNMRILEVELNDDYFGEERYPSLSRLVSVQVKYELLFEGNIEEQMEFWILKLPPIYETARDLARWCRVGEREVGFYNKIFPEIQIWLDKQPNGKEVVLSVPQCLYARYNRELDDERMEELLDRVLIAESIIVLEDLRAKGYGKRPLSDGLSLGECLAAIEEIAKIHAITWMMGNDSADKIKWNCLRYNHKLVGIYENLISVHFPKLIQLVMASRDPDSPRVIRNLQRLSEELRPTLHELLSVSEPPMPTCLIHMDFWIENILFKLKEEDIGDVVEPDIECMIIDWQFVGIGRPTHDLALLLNSSLSPKLRRKHYQLCLKYYYCIFQKTIQSFNMTMPFSFEALENEYYRSCLLSILLAVGSLSIVLLEEPTKIRFLEALKDIAKFDFW